MATLTIDTSKLISRTLESFGLMTKAQADKIASRALESGFYDGLNGNDDPASGDLKSYGYRRESAGGLRDFTKLTQDKIIEIAWTLYQSNPLAKRYFEVIKDHILGRGVEPAIEDEELRGIVATFWSRNNFDEQLPKFVIQRHLFGEQCYPAFVREADGRVTLGYIDPGQIEHVVTHPQNVLIPCIVTLKMQGDRKRRCYRIIRTDEGYVRNGREVVPPKYEDKLVTHTQVNLEPWEQYYLESNGLTEYTGSCFYFSVNNPSNMPRGFTDILQEIDWMDLGDQTLFALGEREQMAAYFAWVVKLIGVDDTFVKSHAAEIRKRVPKKGQALVTNDKEEWTMHAPDLKQPGSIQTFETIRDFVWGLFGLPKTWLGIGEDSNRASAGAMAEPTRRSLEAKQDGVKRMLTAFLAFVRDQAEIAGTWSPATDDSGKINITMPEMTKTDMVQVSATLGTLTDALDKAVSTLKVITRKTAAKAINKVLAEMGVEYDPDEELEAAEAEQAQAEKDRLDKQKAIFGDDNEPPQFGDNGNNGNFPPKQPQPTNGNGKHQEAITMPNPLEDHFREVLERISSPTTNVTLPDINPTIQITQPPFEFKPEFNPQINIPDVIVPEIKVPETIVNVTIPETVVNVPEQLAPRIEVTSPAVIVNVPEQPAPVVNIKEAAVPTMPAPIVNVNPIINIPEQPAPIINVEVPQPETEVLDVERDSQGRIKQAKRTRRYPRK